MPKATVTGRDLVVELVPLNLTASHLASVAQHLGSSLMWVSWCISYHLPARA